jgi:DNA-binding Lrp family transcriptional regulator
MKMDLLDQEIIALLYEDGRMKLTDIGNELGKVLEDKDHLSHVAVQKRLSKLLENNIIKVQANLNIAQLNYISATILIETKEYDAQKRIIERFRLCPRIVAMDQVSGKYNLILRAMAPDLKEMDCFLNMCWLKHEEGIRNYDIYISTTNIKPKFLPLQVISHPNKRTGVAPCGFRCNMCDLYKTNTCKGCPATHFSDTQTEMQNAKAIAEKNGT